MRTLLGLLLAIGPVASARCDERPAAIDFRNDVIPLLVKHGCNAGACHGAALGRGDFRLSLYGGNPAADYDEIVHRARGRRVNLAEPERSLLVLKPTEHVAHGGGTRFDIDDESARILVDWIRRGVPAESPRTLARVEIAPRRHVARATGETVPLRATAHYSDGTRRDVTRWTVLTPEDDSAVSIDRGSPVATIHRRGRHIVVARYLGEVLPIELIVPLTDERVNLADEPRANFVDDRVLETLETLHLPPSPIADDATFLRRVSLDLTGRLPTPETVERFLADDRPQKRAEAVDRLLGSEAFDEFWTFWLAKLLRVRPQRNDRTGADAYHDWLRARVAADASYREIARALLTATGDSHEVGPANFHRTAPTPRDMAELTSEVFLGSRLRCANCHEHPLDRWTQDDYHGLAAILAKVDGDRVVRSRPNGRVIHPRTLEPAVPRLPGTRFLDEADDAPAELADWLTDDANPWFARAIVNRLWKRMLGRGLVEPVDDFRATNPATHPELLDELAADFVTHGHRLRHTLRRIALSRTYARSANATEHNRDDDRFLSHAHRRPLEAEVLADAITDVLGLPESYGDRPPGTRAVALADPTIPSRTLDVLGRCGREESCETTSPAGGLPRMLHLINGPLLNDRIAAAGGRLDRLLAANREPLEIVDAFYVSALGRPPTARERRHWQAELEELETPDERRAFLADLVWGLVTCNEFTTNH